MEMSKYRMWMLWNPFHIVLNEACALHHHMNMCKLITFNSEKIHKMNQINIKVHFKYRKKTAVLSQVQSFCWKVVRFEPDLWLGSGHIYSGDLHFPVNVSRKNNERTHCLVFFESVWLWFVVEALAYISIQTFKWKYILASAPTLWKFPLQLISITWVFIEAQIFRSGQSSKDYETQHTTFARNCLLHPYARKHEMKFIDESVCFMRLLFRISQRQLFSFLVSWENETKVRKHLERYRVQTANHELFKRWDGLNESASRV